LNIQPNAAGRSAWPPQASEDSMLDVIFIVVGTAFFAAAIAYAFACDRV
jgi:hypothetical protein